MPSAQALPPSTRARCSEAAGRGQGTRQGPDAPRAALPAVAAAAAHGDVDGAFGAGRCSGTWAGLALGAGRGLRDRTFGGGAGTGRGRGRAARCVTSGRGERGGRPAAGRGWVRPVGGPWEVGVPEASGVSTRPGRGRVRLLLGGGWFPQKRKLKPRGRAGAAAGRRGGGHLLWRPLAPLGSYGFRASGGDVTMAPRIPMGAVGVGRVARPCGAGAAPEDTGLARLWRCACCDIPPSLPGLSVYACF